jgi:hypothetical protein
MSTTLWIGVAIAVGGVVLYLLVMRVFFRQSRDTDKKIDYSKIREWKDDDD